MNRQYPNYLYHYGVKGMKWGVRKDVQRIGKTAKTKYQKFSNRELQGGVRGTYHKGRAKLYRNAVKANNKDLQGYEPALRREGFSEKEIKESKKGLERVRSNNIKKAEKHENMQKVYKQKQQQRINESVKRGAKLISKNKGGYAKIGVKTIAGSAAVITGSKVVAATAFPATIAFGSLAPIGIAVGLGSAAGAAILAKGARNANDVRNYRKRVK